ncbi:hypothetical protein HG426_002505 [Candidatus Saccharibacteria bacterium]|nr:hypothetical protein [Candidatus Saccharibacteria bacterium]
MRTRSFEGTGSPPPPVREQSKDFTLDNGSVVHTDENGIPDYIEVPPEGDETTPESGQESGAEYGDVEPGQESAEDAAEVQANETLRTDAEVLGNRYLVSRTIKGAGNTLQWGKERIAAGWNNAKEQPGLLKDKFMYGLAKSSYDRRKAKFDEVAHLSDNHPLKKRRMRKLQKAENRVNKRKADIDRRQNRMSGRLETVKNAYESRREATIAELSERADKARARKALRKEMRSKRKEQNENVNVGWFEAWVVAKEHVDSMPKDQRRRIASAIMNAAEASKNSQEASWQARYAERASVDAQNRVEMLGQELGQTRVDLENTRQQAGEIADMEANLVTVKENVAKLREKAESLSDDNANKFAAMNKLVEAERQQAEMEQTIANHRQRLYELWQRQGQLAQELSQAKVNAENAAQALKDKTQQEAAAKKKAKATQTARNQSIENTFV